MMENMMKNLPILTALLAGMVHADEPKKVDCTNRPYVGVCPDLVESPAPEPDTAHESDAKPHVSMDDADTDQ